jgi:hypothetical protein
MRGSLFIAREGVKLGSMSGADARALLEAGFLKPTDDFWREGMEDWRPLAELEQPRSAEKPAQSSWNVRERIRAVVVDAGKLALKLKEVARRGSGTVTKTRERILEDFLPQLRLLATTQLKQASLKVDVALKDDEMMKKFFGAVFDCLPKPVTRFVAEDQFVRFCMKHKASLVGRDETSGNPGS